VGPVDVVERLDAVLETEEPDAPRAGEVLLVAVLEVDVFVPDDDPIDVEELDVRVVFVVSVNPVDTEALVVVEEVAVDRVDPINAVKEGAPVGGEVPVVVVETEALAATVDNMSNADVPTTGGLQDGENII